jgi:1,4-alpha-glucan branching enzyme
MNGSLVLILHTHLPYVLHHGKWPHGSDWLSEAAAECYLPILNECFALLDEGIVPNITISLSPVVVEQLADPDFPAIFNFYLDEKIEAAEEDLIFFADRPQDQIYIPLARFWRDWYGARKRDFNERYHTDIPGAFRLLMEEGAIALQTSGATHGYFALLGRDESIDGQLGVAVASFERHFGTRPRGVWMPECAYRPSYYWRAPVPNSHAPEGMRKGVEQLIDAHGIEYSVVDSHLTRGGRPIGVYSGRFDAVRGIGMESDALPLDDNRSIHDLYRVCSTGDPEAGMMSIFTRDAETTLQVWSGVYGYPGDPEYLEFHKKHHNSGHRYWRVTNSQADLADKTEYHPELVTDRIRMQGAHFVELVENAMREFKERTGREGTLTAPFDTELFGHWWFEGPRFLGEVIRRAATSPTIRVRTAPDELDAKDPGVVIQIPEGSWGEGGGHNVWLNEGTAWTWPRVYEVEWRFLKLLEDHDPSDAADLRLLLQMARENLLLQASDWQFLITTASAADYASERFIGHYDNAIRLAGYIEAHREGARLTPEEYADIRHMESVDRLFPDLTLDQWRTAPALQHG